MAWVIKNLIRETRDIGVNCFLESQKILKRIDKAKQVFKSVATISQENKILTEIFAMLSQHKALVYASNSMMEKFQDMAGNINLFFLEEDGNANIQSWYSGDSNSIYKKTGKTTSILHLDDSKDFSRMLKLHFESEDNGFNIEFVTDIKDFMAKAEQKVYDVFIVDYVLERDMDGLDVLRVLRGRNIKTPFILLSGRYESPLMRQTLVEHERAEYVQKGIDIRLLVEVLSSKIKNFIAKKDILLVSSY